MRFREVPASAGDESTTETRLVELNDAEAQWMDAHLDAATDAGVDMTSAEDIGHLFDIELRAWLSEPENEDPNTAINIVGLCLGEHLRRRFSMRWVALPDAGGNLEMAVHRPSDDVILTPIVLVAKLWQADAIGELPQLCEQLAARLQPE